MPFGVNMLGPVLIKYGNEAQKRHWLPRILDGSDWWCQGYSEPGAGSDLAAVKTSAVRGIDAQGDHYIVNVDLPGRTAASVISDNYWGAQQLTQLDDLRHGLVRRPLGDRLEDEVRLRHDAASREERERFQAIAAAKAAQLPAFADDSGLVVDALDGAPGVYSARWAKLNNAGAGDADNNRLLLRQLERVADDRRSIAARAAAALPGR